jgi:undecaprenyl-diphosphatase
MFPALTAFDQSASLAITDLAVSSSFMSFVAIVCAQWLPYFAIMAVVVYEFMTDDDPATVIPERLRRIMLPVILAWVIVVGIKIFIHEPRPFVGELGIVPLVHVVDPFSSFPSAHSAVFAALFGAMLAVRFPYARYFGGVMLVVGFGRIAAGVHWPTDVFVGLLLGLLVGFFGAWFLTRWQTKKYFH